MRVVLANGERPLFDGQLILKNSNIEIKCILNILFSPELQHYNVITSLTGITVCDNFCQACNIGTKRISTHKCPEKCDRCFHNSLCDRETLHIKCVKCLREFYGEKCFRQHETVGSFKNNISVCEGLKNVYYVGKLYQ